MKLSLTKRLLISLAFGLAAGFLLAHMMTMEAGTLAAAPVPAPSTAPPANAR